MRRTQTTENICKSWSLTWPRQIVSTIFIIRTCRRFKLQSSRCYMMRGRNRVECLRRSLSRRWERWEGISFQLCLTYTVQAWNLLMTQFSNRLTPRAEEEDANLQKWVVRVYLITGTSLSTIAQTKSSSTFSKSPKKIFSNSTTASPTQMNKSLAQQEEPTCYEIADIPSTQPKHDIT